MTEQGLMEALRHKTQSLCNCLPLGLHCSSHNTLTLKKEISLWLREGLSPFHIFFGVV